MNNTAFCQYYITLHYITLQYYFIRDFELWHNEGCISEQQKGSCNVAKCNLG